jgi:predicted  nucleic acid-binding Zn-ribbon protein
LEDLMTNPTGPKSQGTQGYLKPGEAQEMWGELDSKQQQKLQQMQQMQQLQKRKEAQDKGAAALKKTATTLTNALGQARGRPPQNNAEHHRERIAAAQQNAQNKATTRAQGHSDQGHYR